jgi:hypothetical protein
MVYGPTVTKPVTVPEHVRHVLDLDAYWNLGFDGELLPGDGEPTLLYAKVAYPTVASAQAQFRLQADAQALRSAPKPRRRPVRGGRLRRTEPPGDEEDGRCTASSWGGASHKPYGPGGYNRCVIDGAHEVHRDDFGNEFTWNPDAAGGQKDPRVRVLREPGEPA